MSGESDEYDISDGEVDFQMPDEGEGFKLPDDDDILMDEDTMPKELLMITDSVASIRSEEIVDSDSVRTDEVREFESVKSDEVRDLESIRSDEIRESGSTTSGDVKELLFVPYASKKREKAGTSRSKPVAARSAFLYKESPKKPTAWELMKKEEEKFVEELGIVPSPPQHYDSDEEEEDYY